MGQRRRQARAEEEARRRAARRRLAFRAASLVVAVAAIGGVVLLRDARHAAAGTSFAIVSPAAGATVASPVHLRVDLHGAELGVPTSGLDHLHVSVDGGLPVPLYEAPAVTIPLAPGPHTIAVELAGPDHAPLLPAQTVTFSVRG